MFPVALDKEKNLLSFPIHGGALMQPHTTETQLLPNNQESLPPENRDRFDQWAHDAFPLFVTIWSRNGGAARVMKHSVLLARRRPKDSWLERLQES